MSENNPGPEDTTPIARREGPMNSTDFPETVDNTRSLPPVQTQPETATRARKGRVPAAVLASALVLGGAAGFGGAAAYNAVNSDMSSGSTTSSSATTSAGGAVVADNTSATAGTVESVASKVLPSVVTINVTGGSEAGSGSGIILNSAGRILTNNHVVAVAGSGGTITVQFNNGKTAKAKVLGTDPLTDTALIEAEGVSGLTPAVIGNSDSLKVGQQVVALGAPFGLQATVTSGIVSALNRPVSVSTEPETPQGGGIPFDPFSESQPQPQQGQADLSTTYPAIQTDAAINPGNSGGPLVDMAGRVVGINSSIRSSSASGEGGSIGLGFAIPMTEVLPIINQIADGQTPTHARLGVTVSDTAEGASVDGALVKSLDSNAAAQGVLKAGDVVTKVDNQLIDGSESLVATVRGHRPGDKVTLTFIRGGKEQTAEVTLASDEAARDS